jgi:hypothetical protein
MCVRLNGPTGWRSIFSSTIKTSTLKNLMPLLKPLQKFTSLRPTSKRHGEGEMKAVSPPTLLNLSSE